MSVYTSITSCELRTFWNDYDLGELVDFHGIAEGISNSNYRINSTQGEFILTLFEHHSKQEATHFVRLLRYLGQREAIFPYPEADRQGRTLRILRHKPAVVCARLPGQAIASPTVGQCREVGRHLARLHHYIRNHELPIASSHDLPSMQRRFELIFGQLVPEDRALILDELRFQQQLDTSMLPAGAIHGDLFRDNALFIGERLGGIVDFNSACRDFLLRDVAITINDWCGHDESFNFAGMQALLAGYLEVRALNGAERHLLLPMLRASALRFWLSRLVHHFGQRSGELTHAVDPAVFKRLLLRHRSREFVQRLQNGLLLLLAEKGWSEEIRN